MSSAEKWDPEGLGDDKFDIIAEKANELRRYIAKCNSLTAFAGDTSTRGAWGPGRLAPKSKDLYRLGNNQGSIVPGDLEVHQTDVEKDPPMLEISGRTSRGYQAVNESIVVGAHSSRAVIVDFDDPSKNFVMIAGVQRQERSYGTVSPTIAKEIVDVPEEDITKMLTNGYPYTIWPEELDKDRVGVVIYQGNRYSVAPANTVVHTFNDPKFNFLLIQAIDGEPVRVFDPRFVADPELTLRKLTGKGFRHHHNIRQDALTEHFLGEHDRRVAEEDMTERINSIFEGLDFTGFDQSEAA